MSNSQHIFQIYLTQLEALLKKSATQKNPAMWLYKNNARTTLFMLEALSRMFKTFHNKKRFTKMQVSFKILEDSLGALDYYYAFIETFKTNKKIPKEIIAYLDGELDNTCDALNAYLKDSYFEKHAQIDKIKNKLETAKWLNEKKETKAIIGYYVKEICVIADWMKQFEKGFTSIETQVHELRRKLRWLSILPQALNGKIQLKDVEVSATLKKYQTKDVINSPFNKLPEIGKLESVVTLNKPAFYALSWMIAQLGIIKDQGLTEDVLSVAYANIHLTTKEKALEITNKYITKPVGLPALLKQASTIANTYFNEKDLQSLVL